MTEHAFRAEVAQVLDLVIHSLYRNKEIFLRELISNASDALDKLRFEALTNPDLVGEIEPQIRILPDPDAGTLTLWDNGIGMSHDELIENLGTVAHSGTKAFLEALKEQDTKKDVSLIGQFGVGFYSAFLVSDRVEVTSRRAGSDEAHKWSSDARESFTIEPAERESHGTTIVLHLAEDQKEFLGAWRLRNLVKEYSDYVEHPIKLAIEKPATEDDADAGDEGEAADEAATETAFEVINQQGALWQRAPEDIDDEQYDEFYRHLTHDWEAPLARNHFSIEGTQQFTALLYVPRRPPFDLFDRDTKHGVRLFVKRVFIMDDAEALLPVWLRFVKGVVDSDDLPLNVSRDVLQDSRGANVIKKQLTKKALEMLEEIAAERPEDYEALWNDFGKVLKEGLHFEGDKQRQRLAKLIRFETSTAEGLTGFEQYVERMPEGQKAIYYALGATRGLVEHSPHTEALKARGHEVIYFTDPVDQWAVDGLKEFADLPLVSVSHADLELEDDSDKTEEQKKADEEKKESFAPLTERFEEVLGDKVREVRLSKRLADSPVCLVIPEGGLPSHIERMLRAHDQSLPQVPRILEINPDHPIIVDLGKNVQAEEAAEYIELLYDQALLIEGSPIDDPAQFATRMSRLMAKSLGG